MNEMLSPSDKIIIAYSVQKYLLDQCHDWSINPLSPDSDQHQFSPNDIRTMSRD